MQFIPVDQDRFSNVVALGQTRPDADQQGTQKERDGVPVWKITVLVNTSPDEKPSVEDIKVPHSTEPLLTAMTAIEFDNLTAVAWQMNGRAGVSLRADGFQEA